MTILLAPESLGARRAAAAGGLAPLADSLAADLAPVAARPVWLPPEKARLTRRGGWCPRDGTRLDFEPSSPHAHRCPRCDGVFDGDDHYRWWIVGYQLWLAERAVHGATLALVGGRPELGDFADRVLLACADAYASYPNADNVLGPSRPFFSTYLESIWLLQLAVALSLREAAGAPLSLGSAVRERVVEPSSALIASYDEGASNRQVWNNAALLASDALLGRRRHRRAFDGPSGLLAHLRGGLLADGSWYEGENYHLFAHRGLWYGAVLATRLGFELPDESVARLDAGFVTPFLTALPDYTFPSRRDSAYEVSLRQWRFAELAEIGAARSTAPELLGALATLYDPSVPRTSTERSRSTAETERNAPASGLSRADLGWRSLLFARETLPAVRVADENAWSPGTVVLPAQGLAVVRRERGALYAALDYGTSGGGHGHPDRLNVLLSDGDARWQDDVGTGAYTEPTLHWYRSALAHAAPLVDGRTQRRVDGELLSFDDREEHTLVRARAAIDERVSCARTLIVGPDYVITHLSWTGDGEPHDVELPIHADGDDDGGDWTPGLPDGPAEDDGYAFLEGAEHRPLAVRDGWRLRARLGEHAADLWCWSDREAVVWRAHAPGPPGTPALRRMHAVRARGTDGRIAQLWSTRGAIVDAHLSHDDALVLTRADGQVMRHTIHGRFWVVERWVPSGTPEGGDVDSSIARTATFDPRTSTRGSAESRARSDRSTDAARDRAVDHAWVVVVGLDRGGPPRLQDGAGTAEPRHPRPAPGTNPAPALGARPIEVWLVEQSYRRSELEWRDAGAPAATVSLAVVDRTLLVMATVTKTDDLAFAPAELRENPLDNEHPDTNADGVQLHLVAIDRDGGETALEWLAVPLVAGLRLSPLTPAAADVAAAAHWTPSAVGYTLDLRVPLPADAHALALDVIINETSPARERRRGQLVLSGGAGEYVYLRGARQSRDRLLPFSLPHVV